MTEFNLRIVTPDGVSFEGKAESITVRTTEGNVGILARHIPYAAPLTVGEAKVVYEGKTKTAACGGGLLSVMPDMVTIAATTFEWADEIDIERANRAKIRADKIINEGTQKRELELAQAKLKRALVRISAAEHIAR